MTQEDMGTGHTRRDFMKVAGACAAVIALPGCALPPMNSGSKEKRPNIIFLQS